MISVNSYISNCLETPQENRQAYANYANESVRQVVDLIRQGRGFDDCFDHIRERRRSLANDREERGASSFGLSRLQVSDFICSTRLLDVRYQEYSQKFYESLCDLKEDWYQQQGPEEVINTRSFKLEKLTPRKVAEILRSRLRAPGPSETEMRLNTTTQEMIECYNENYKRAHPKEYLDDSLRLGLQVIEEHKSMGLELPPDGADVTYFVGTSRFPMTDEKGGMNNVAMTRFICPVAYVPLSRTENQAYPLPLLLIHQDRYLVPTTMRVAQQAFREALEWKASLGAKELKDRVGKMRYCLAHAMPDVRGSAAEAEWLEAAIYRHHGFAEAHQKESCVVDLEALTSTSFDQFMQRYHASIVGVK